MTVTVLADLGPTRAAAAQPAPLPSEALAQRVTERPDAISASIAARTQGSRVEVTDARSETSTTFANPDGSVTVDDALSPVRVRRGDRWLPVDLSLLPSGEGLRPAASPADVHLSRGGSGAVATLTRGRSAVGLGWPAPLPEPTVAGPVASYQLGDRMQLRVTATSTGFNQHLVLNERLAEAPVVRVPLRLRGLSLVEQPDGGLHFVDGKGTAVATMAPPKMWGAQLDPLTDTPTREAAVTARVDYTASGPVLVLSPSAEFLADPAVTYPVVIDPDIASVTRVRDTYVRSNTDLSYGHEERLLNGTYNGSTLYRSFAQWDTPSLPAGSRVVSSKVRVYNYNSGSCDQTKVINAHPVSAAWTIGITWASQPSINTSSAYRGSASFAHGNETAGCANAYDSIDVTNMVKGWVSGAIANYGLALRASETDTGAAKSLCSMNQNPDPAATCSTGAQNPTLSVTYNSYPADPASVQFSDSATYTESGTTTRYVRSLTPSTSAVAADPDGGQVGVDFDIWDAAGTTRVSCCWTGYFPSGSRVSRTSATLVNGAAYKLRVRAWDGADWNKANWLPWVAFTVDASAPASPAVSSVDYPQGAWSRDHNSTGSFTLAANGSSDVTGYYYGLDDGTPDTYVAAGSLGGSVAVSLTPAEGKHTLYVQSRDRAGNRSASTGYAFNVCCAQLTSPVGGSRTDGVVTLSAMGRSDWTTARYQWRRADTDSWTDIPEADVRTPSGAPVTWPLVVADGVVPTLTWNTTATARLDGPLQVRVQVASLSATDATEPTRISLDQRFSAAAAAEVGPGSVNLRTGELTVSDSDVSIDSHASDLSVARSFASRSPAAGMDGAFGPGWVLSLPVEDADSDYLDLVESGPLVTVGLPGAGSVGFTATSASSYAPEEGAEALALRKISDTTGVQFELSDLDGNITNFTRPTDADRFYPTAVTQPGNTQTTSYRYASYTRPDGSRGSRIVRVVAPQPAGVDCTSAPTTTRGCRSLAFVYADPATPLPTAGAIGPFPHRLVQVDFTSYDADTAAMVTTAVAGYGYDDTGRLRRAWDPRLPALVARYSYTPTGQLATLSPPAEETWTFGYDGADTARLVEVERPSLDPVTPTATTTVVYNVPVDGTGAPYDLSPAARQRWGQEAVPVQAVAFFPATQVPASPPTSYERAALSYLDTQGRQVNTVTPGGHVSTTEYDPDGNVVRELTAGNRARALDAAGGDSAAQEAAIAATLDTRRIYSHDGLRLVEEYGPEHDVVVTPGADPVRARSHTLNRYDEGAPSTGGPYHLVTTSSTGARMAGETADRDVRTTTTGYDWALRQPTSVTVDPGDTAAGKLNLVSRTSYDPVTGLETSSTLPAGSSTGDTAATLKTTYYATAANSSYPECGGRPEWANLVCRTDPGGQPMVTADAPAIPTISYTYTRFNAAKTTTEAAGGATLRTGTIGYDSADRPVSATIEASTGTALPTQRTVYDSNGRVVETQTVDTAGTVTATVKTSYDTLGRVTSYTDADGNVARTSYDLLGRPTRLEDGKGTQDLFYDDGGERRGLMTRITDSDAGTFTASYDADGSRITQDYPNGLRRAESYNETGSVVGLRYDKTGCTGEGCTWLTFSVEENVHGQWIDHTGGVSSQSYRYDQAGRLTTVQDTPARQGCTSRLYGFTANSNRTQLTSRDPNADGSCATTGGTTTSSSYDTADRITDAGYRYDTLGRTLAVPAAHARGAELTAEYYSNDLVRSLTQGGASKTWTLDPTQQRFRSWTDGAVTRINHYTDDSDSPDWINEGNGTYSRNVRGIGGDLAAIRGADGTTVLQLANLRGDIVATSSLSSADVAPTASFDATEYGAPRTTTDRRYGWLGAKQRSADSIAGVVLMGVRLYNAATGRFLSTDPIRGGNANSYVYPADPVNAFDLDGKFCLRCALGNRIVRFVATSIVVAATCWNPVSCLAVGAVVGAGLRYADHRLNRRRGSVWKSLIRGAREGAFTAAGGLGRTRHLRALGYRFGGRHLSSAVRHTRFTSGYLYWKTLGKRALRNRYL